MKTLLLLTDQKTRKNKIIIGTESIIGITYCERLDCSKIQSRGAMIETFYVIETIAEIWEQANN